MVVVGYLAVLTAIQRQVLFPGTAYPPEPISDSSLQAAGIERQWFEINGGRVEGWFMAANTTRSAPAVIFAHGNGELIEHWPQMLAPWTELGFHLLLVEYPGYGRSSGVPGFETVQQGFVAAYDWLVNRSDVDSEKIIGFGRSLGGGAITALGEKRSLKALLLASTFTSVADMARRFLLPGMLVKDKFDNRAFLRKFNGPVLVVHGRQDELISWSHGESLHKVAPGSRLIGYPAGHNDCPPDWQRFWSDVRTWLADSGLLV